MSRLGTMFVGGVLGLVGLKLIIALLGPMFFMLKLVAMGLLAYFLYSLIRKKQDDVQEVS